MPPSAPQIVVGQRYELVEIVGQGGYGVVYRARDQKLDRTVAVKVLSPGTSADPHLFERLQREQQAMDALQGSSAVTAIDLCHSPNGALCLVMEWLDGADLERHLASLEQAGRRLELARLMVILDPVVETLQRAHQLGIVHRDVKPANIFLLTHGGVKLLDFGLSRMRTSAPLTAMGTVMGSPSYIAPEVWRGDSSVVDHRADLYSLAVIVFRALTGDIPFPTNSLAEKLQLVTTAPRPQIRGLRPDLPPGIDDWIEQALAIDPAYRFNTARALLTALALSLEMPRHRDAMEGWPELDGVHSQPEPSTAGTRTSEIPLLGDSAILMEPESVAELDPAPGSSPWPEPRSRHTRPFGKAKAPGVAKKPKRKAGKGRSR